MKIYEKKFLFNLAKLKVDTGEIYIRILMMKFRWKHRFFDAGQACRNIQPYAFIRVCNESPTLSCSLNSILPAITRGIIAYNDCTDGSEGIILDFCRGNPGFIPARYDFFNIYRDEPIADKLTRYYNWALSLMPRNEWLVKIDADQIYDAEKLSAAFRMVRTTKDVIVLPRIELHYEGKDLFVIDGRPFNFSMDHWVIFNDQNLYFAPYDRFPCEALVILDNFQRNMLFSEVPVWHFPLMKAAKSKFVAQTRLVRLDEWLANWNGGIYDTFHEATYPNELLDRKMLDKERIMKYVEQFDTGNRAA